MQDLNKTQVMLLQDYKIGDDFKINADSNNSNITGINSDVMKGLYQSDFGCWDYWRDHYYPTIIHHDYPVYIQERAKDKGKEAFEIIKMLKDSRFLKLDTVGDFIDLMDKLIKIL